MADAGHFRMVGESYTQARLALSREWDHVRRNRHPRVVLIEGESGCGKSRVVQAFYEELVRTQAPDQQYWRPGLEPVSTPSNSRELNELRKLVTPDHLFEGERVPAWFWFGVLCTQDAAGNSVDVGVSSLIPQLVRQIIWMLLRESRGVRAWAGIQQAGVHGLELAKQFARLFPGLGTAAEVIDLIQAPGEVREHAVGLTRSLLDAKHTWQMAADDEAEMVAAARTRLIESAFAAFDGHPAGGLPVVVVVDDAHFARSPLLRFLRSTIIEGNGAAPRPWLIILTAWPHELRTSDAALAEWLVDIAAAKVDVVKIDLGDPLTGRLGRNEFRELTADALPGLQNDQREALEDRLFVTDVILPHTAALALASLRGVETRGQLGQVDGEWMRGNIDQAPTEELERRFDALGRDPDLRPVQAMLLEAALFGFTFPNEVIRTKEGRDPDGILEAAHSAGAFIQPFAPPIPLPDGSPCAMWSFESAEALAWTREQALREPGVDETMDYVADRLVQLLEESLDYFESDVWRDHWRVLSSLRVNHAQRLVEVAGKRLTAAADAVAYAHAALLEADAIVLGSWDLTDHDSYRYLDGQLGSYSHTSRAGFAALVNYCRVSVAGARGRGIAELLGAAIEEQPSVTHRYGRVAIRLYLDLLDLDRLGDDEQAMLGRLAASDSRIALALAGARRKAGHQRDAIAALDGHERVQEAALMLSDVYLELNEPGQAADALRRATHLQEPALRLAKLLEESGDVDEAIAVLRGTMLPSRQLAMELARLLRERDPEEALVAVVDFANDYPSCALVAADLYVEMDEREAAMRLLEEHVLQNADCAMRLARIQEDGGRLHEAVDVLDSHLNDTNVVLLKAQILKRNPQLGGPDAAIEFLRGVPTRTPLLASFQAGLLLSRGLGGDAEEALAETLSFRDTQQCAHSYARAAFETGRITWAEAIELVAPHAAEDTHNGRQLAWYLLQQLDEVASGTIVITNILANYGRRRDDGSRARSYLVVVEPNDPEASISTWYRDIAEIRARLPDGSVVMAVDARAEPVAQIETVLGSRFVQRIERAEDTVYIELADDAPAWVANLQTIRNLANLTGYCLRVDHPKVGTYRVEPLKA